VGFNYLGLAFSLIGDDHMNINTETYLQRAYDLIKLAIENDKFESELSPYDVKLLKLAMQHIARTF